MASKKLVIVVDFLRVHTPLTEQSPAHAAAPSFTTVYPNSHSQLTQVVSKRNNFVQHCSARSSSR